MAITWETIIIFGLIAPASGFVHPYCTEDCTGLATGQYGHCDQCNLFIYCDHDIQRVASCPKEYTLYDWTLGVCVHHRDSTPCPKDWKPAPRTSGSVNSGNYPTTGITSSGALKGPEKARHPTRGGQVKTGSGFIGGLPEDRKKTSAYTGAAAPHEPPMTNPYPPAVEVRTIAPVPPPPPPPPPTTTWATTTTTTTSATTTAQTAAAAAATSGGGGEATRMTVQKSCGTPCHAQCPSGPKAQVYVRCGDCCYMVCSPEGKLLREACPHPNVRTGQ